MRYELGNIKCYLLGKWQRTCTATEKDDYWCKKMPYIYFNSGKAPCMDICYMFIFTIFLKTEQMW